MCVICTTNIIYKGFYNDKLNPTSAVKCV